MNKIKADKDFKKNIYKKIKVFSNIEIIYEKIIKNN